MQLILSYFDKYQCATKEKIRELLWVKLSDSLTDNQKEYKIGNLLTVLRKENRIEVIGREGRHILWQRVDKKSDR